MKVYLAGPMRGHPGYNYPAFHEATAFLREIGHEVFNPAEHGLDVDPESDTALREYMKIDLPAVLDSDTVVVLDGWERSKGASLEVYVAEAVGIPVVSYPKVTRSEWLAVLEGR